MTPLRPRDALVADIERARDRHDRNAPGTPNPWRDHHNAIFNLNEIWWMLDNKNDTNTRVLTTNAVHYLTRAGADPALIERVRIAYQIPANGDSL